MKQGIVNTKAAMSEWVSPLMHNAPVPVPDSGSQSEKSGDEEPQMTAKKDPILLALEKESQAFDPSFYLKKGDPLSSGEQSLWMST